MLPDFSAVSLNFWIGIQAQVDYRATNIIFFIISYLIGAYIMLASEQK